LDTEDFTFNFYYFGISNNYLHKKLFNYNLFFTLHSGGKAAGAWRWSPTLSSAEIKEKVGKAKVHPRTDHEGPEGE
jgi:hypothetical protein